MKIVWIALIVSLLLVLSLPWLLISLPTPGARPGRPRCLKYTIIQDTTLYYTILYYTILYYTILYYTTLYYTILSSVVQATLAVAGFMFGMHHVLDDKTDTSYKTISLATFNYGNARHFCGKDVRPDHIWKPVRPGVRLGTGMRARARGHCSSVIIIIIWTIVCVHVCVCMYVCMHVCMCNNMHAYIHTHIHTHTYIYARDDYYASRPYKQKYYEY